MQGRVDVAGDLGSLAWVALPTPSPDVPLHAPPDKLFGEGMGGGLGAPVGEALDDLEDGVGHGGRDKGPSGGEVTPDVDITVAGLARVRSRL